ncbi:MAG: 3'-5' exonuclease [Gammaproteobacteria bacterium]|nr:3'-5' exonuclease [Gammaproteobacteria bacterium]
MNVLVFDIETVPDVEAGRQLYALPPLAESDVAKIMFHRRREESGSEFLRHYLHRVVAISVLLRHGDSVKVWSLGEEDAGEADILQRFFEGIERFQPTLVSWNGSGFDLPVLHYRALRHGLDCHRYWEAGDGDPAFRWNNYLSRYHQRHTDVMDVLSGYQSRAAAPLDEIALFLGFPGKQGAHGSAVWARFQEGDVRGIRDYCETDVLNTYLIYLRLERMRGHLDATAHAAEEERLRTFLADSGKAHLQAFLAAWPRSAS